MTIFVTHMLKPGVPLPVFRSLHKNLATSAPEIVVTELPKNVLTDTSEFPIAIDKLNNFKQHLDADGQLTILLQVSQPEYFKHYNRQFDGFSYGQPVTDHFDWLHSKVFDFGTPYRPKVTILAGDEESLWVTYTTTITKPASTPNTESDNNDQ